MQPGLKALSHEMASRPVARTCGLLCAGIGFWGLLAWGLHAPLLSSFSPNYIPMSPRSALGSLLLGLVLVLYTHPWQLPWRKSYFVVPTTAVLLLGSLSLGESLLRYGLYSQANLFHPPPTFDDYLVVRMSRLSATTLMLGAAGLLLLLRPVRPWSHWLPGMMGTLISGSSFVVLLGYLYGAPLLYGGAVRPVPVLGALASLAGGVGLLAATGRQDVPLRWLLGSSVRARLLRTFLPITFFVVLLDKLLSDLFRWYRLMNPALQDSLQTLVSALAVTAAVSYIAHLIGRSLDQAEAQRQQSELALRQARDQLEQRVQERTATLAMANAALSQEVARRQQVERTLEESERRIRLIAENAEAAIFAFDMNRRLLYVNPAVVPLTGYSPAELRQAGFINWIHPDDQERMLKHWEELYAGRGYSEVEFRLVTKSGQVKWCSSTWGPLLDEAGRQIGVRGREWDITERKRLEAELLEISAQERRRLGHDLHDGLGQYLAGIALKAKLLEGALAMENSTQRPRAQEIVGLLNQAIRQTRTLAHGLDPIHVEANGLVAALATLAAQTRDLFNVECRFTSAREQLPVNLQTGLALYRITQEAIHNAICHGRARLIELELALQAPHLCLSIRDNGIGFPPASEPRPDSGMGLHIMRYRANSVGGALTIEPLSPQGTRVQCQVPWTADPPMPDAACPQPAAEA